VKENPEMKRVKTYLAGLLLGGTLVLGDCDPQIREALLTGAESTATALSGLVIGSAFDQLGSDAAS
jgi:hypothetical protein